MIEESGELSWDEKRELRRKKRLRSFQEIDRYFFGRKWPISTENDQVRPIFGVVTYLNEQEHHQVTNHRSALKIFNVL